MFSLEAFRGGEMVDELITTSIPKPKGPKSGRARLASPFAVGNVVGRQQTKSKSRFRADKPNGEKRRRPWKTVEAGCGNKPKTCNR